MATVAVGGRRGRAGLEMTLIALAAAGLTVGFLAFPLLVSPLGSEPMFVPHRSRSTSSPPRSHTSPAPPSAARSAPCAHRRGSNGPPPSRRRRLAALLALVPLGALGGPVAVARAMTDAARGTITGHELLAALSCLVLAALVLTPRRKVGAPVRLGSTVANGPLALLRRHRGLGAHAQARPARATCCAPAASGSCSTAARAPSTSSCAASGCRTSTRSSSPTCTSTTGSGCPGC